MKIGIAGMTRVVVLCTLAGAGTTAALPDEIDRLFAEFNRQNDAGNSREAEATARQMVANSLTSEWKAASYNCLGIACDRQGRRQEAIEAYRVAGSFPLPLDNEYRGWIPNNLGLVYSSLRQYAEAERYLNLARERFEKSRGTDSREVATVYRGLGRLYRDQHRYAVAEPFCKAALRISEKVLGEDDAEVAWRLRDLAELYLDQSRHEAAEPVLNRAISILEKARGPEHPDVATALMTFT